MSKQTSELLAKSISDANIPGVHGIELKSLNTIDSDSAGLAIDEEVQSTIEALARNSSAVLSDVRQIEVSTSDFRKLTQATGTSVESSDEADPVDVGSTPAFASHVISVGKYVSKGQATDEALNDTATFQFLIEDTARSFKEHWGNSIVVGDDSTGPTEIDGITSIHHIAFGANESGELDPELRKPAFFYAVKTGIADNIPADSSILDLMTEMLTSLPESYINDPSVCWYMPKSTFKALLDVSDDNGNKSVRSIDGKFYIHGKQIKLDGSMPDPGADTVPMMIGNLDRAFAFCNIDNVQIYDQYTLDGAVQLKSSSRKGSLMGNHDAMVALHCSV